MVGLIAEFGSIIDIATRTDTVRESATHLPRVNPLKMGRKKDRTDIGKNRGPGRKAKKQGDPEFPDRLKLNGEFVHVLKF